ncbi:MAG TPA: hypothetical protein DDZ96_09300 [Porphyromonadaceae bacterium]|uniref:YceD family protein n=1 Tax=Limibacterium fermenti TaxID=3229863 RepID=UPI000E89DAE7|nr:hypothetical protein [Porphyromonadaceae bacterium]HBK31811.1 hypothetical protein [Porphyromonadaceae bacterium]HBL33992.1 hypothetical protein [Porphyromonadaceae bacterium]HBX20847.1 hypothetical protein [Porphyromonadaceae bacterium]HBX47033.1 hypothetical protein [Porphyromonadaceae bacterium]
MAKFSLYNISLKNLSEGVHPYEYDLDRKFFDAIDSEEVRKGNVHVTLAVKKVSSAYEFDFELKGNVQVPCARCLDEMDLEVYSKNHLIVKLGKEYLEESDEIIIIPEEEGAINIAWFLYEFIALAIPIKPVHPKGECNRTMSSKLKKHRAVSRDDDDSEDTDEIEDDMDDDVEDASDVQTPDPRWEALKGLNLEE